MTDLCGRCGAAPGERHAWVEGDCVLRHRAHARATVGLCCAGCVDRIGEWLADIVTLFDDLPKVVPLGSVPDTTAKHKHGHPVASPAMMRLDAWSMVYDRDRLWYTGNRSDIPDVPAVLADLAYRLADSLGVSPGTGLGGDPGRSAAFLSAHVGRMVGFDWVISADDDLRWVRGHLRQAHGIAEPRTLGRCLSVVGGEDCPGWVRESETRGEKPFCTRCRRRYGPLDLVRLKVMNP